MAAAWVAVGVVAGLWLGFIVGIASERKRQRAVEEEKRLRQFVEQSMKRVEGRGHDSDQAILERVLDRLLDVTVPKVREEPPEESPTTGHDAEYVPPDDDWTGAMDWTDPFLGGEERPLVGRLAPGQGIPGIPVVEGQVDPVEVWREKGESAFDEWARETVMGGQEPEAWVEPIEGV